MLGVVVRYEPIARIAGEDTTMTRIARVACLATAVWSLVGLAHPSAAQAPPDTRKKDPTLSERTTAAGGRWQERIDPGDVPIATLDELTARAPVVIVGRVLGARSRVGADDREVATVVAVSVHAVVKGAVLPEALLYVRTPGGSHRYADGRTVHQTVAGYRSFRVGGAYLVYLRPLRPATSVPAGKRGPLSPDRAQYELAVGPQGAFELDYTAGTVTPAAAALDHPLAVRYATASLRAFLREAFRAADVTRPASLAGGR
jgi:hypothetical protein